MPKSSNRREIEEFISAIDPGVQVQIGEHPGTKKPVTVVVHEIRNRDMLRLVDGVAKSMPRIQEAIMAAGPLATLDSRTRGSLAAQIALTFGKDLGDLIESCVEPEGVFRILPTNISHNVIATWVEVNILNPGKLNGWKQAFEPLMVQIEGMFPPKTGATPLNSSSDTATTPTESAITG